MRVEDLVVGGFYKEKHDDDVLVYIRVITEGIFVGEYEFGLVGNEFDQGAIYNDWQLERSELEEFSYED